MMGSMIIFAGDRKAAHFMCPACSYGWLGEGSAPAPDSAIPTFYSERHAKDEGWRKTTHPDFCSPGRSHVWVCPDCWPGDAEQEGGT